jgi:arginase family enzyme
MLPISDYFEKPVIDIDFEHRQLSDDYLFRQIIGGDCFDGNWDDVNVAIIGITDGCNSPGNEQCGKAPDIIRKELMKLAGFEQLKIIDLGNIKGNGFRNKISALADVVPFLLENGIVTVVLGGSQHYMHPLSVLVAGQNKITVSVADSKVDMVIGNEDYSSINFMGAMVEELGDRLSQCFLIGTQRYFIPQSTEIYINHNIFENIRLGNIRGEQFKAVEPFLRDSDVLGIDVSVVRSIDMPAQKGVMPNGLFAHELCQLTRYAGISDNMKLMGLFEMNPDSDSAGEPGASLMAQGVWHFLDGVAHRYFDYPVVSVDNYDKYVVFMDDLDSDITFYRNAINNRWWVKIPTSEGENIISCSEEDFKMAQANEFPDRWFKMLIKSS